MSYLQMGIGILINLIYTPVLIRLMGQSEYGLYNTVASAVSMLSLLSLGFNASYIRYYSRYKVNNDKDAIYRLNGMFLSIFLLLGGISLICGTVLVNHLQLVFQSGLTAQEYETAKILTFLLTINLSISFPMSVFTSIISAHEQFIYLKLLGIAKTVLAPSLTLPLLFLGFRSIAMVSVTLAVSCMTDIAYAFYVIWKLKQKFIFHGFEKGLFKNLTVYTAFIAINMIVDQVNNNVDNVLLGRFQGTSAVAVYAVGQMLYSSYSMFSTSISGVFTPRIHQIIAETEDNLQELKLKITDLFIRVGRIQFLILGLICSGFVFFGKKFILQFWAGAGYEESYYVALLLILPASIALIQNLGIEIQRAENKHQFRSVAYFIMACVNLILTVFLCQKYGAVGAAAGTAVSLILANGLIMNLYYHHRCGINIIAFWKNILLESRGLIIPVAFGLFIQNQINSANLIIFILFILLYTAIYLLSMWLFGMNRDEKQFIIGVFRDREVN